MGLKNDLYDKRQGLNRLETKKGRKIDYIDDFLRKNFEMAKKMSSENTPFLNSSAGIIPIRCVKFKIK